MNNRHLNETGMFIEDKHYSINTWICSFLSLLLSMAHTCSETIQCTQNTAATYSCSDSHSTHHCTYVVATLVDKCTRVNKVYIINHTPLSGLSRESSTLALSLSLQGLPKEFLGFCSLAAPAPVALRVCTLELVLELPADTPPRFSRVYGLLCRIVWAMTYIRTWTFT